MPKYENFDHSASFEQTGVTFSWSRFSRTKVILAVTALTLVALVVLFAGLYGHAEYRLSERTRITRSNDANDQSDEAQTQTTDPSDEPPTQTTDPSDEPPTQTTDLSDEPHIQTTDPSDEPHIQTTDPSDEPHIQTTDPSAEPQSQTDIPECTEPRCLQISARVLQFMNLTTDPCQTFYEYACGNYDAVNDHWGRHITDDIAHDNKERLIKILEDPLPTSQSPGGAEEKVKAFYNSCMDQKYREMARGTPLIKQLLDDIGGWNVMDDWNITNWNFNKALKKVQMDFTARAIYRPEVVVLDGKPGIWIHESGISQYIQTIDEYKEDAIMASYKKLIRTVGSYLIRDLGNTTVEHQDHLDDFVNDIILIESKLATYQWRPESYFTDPNFDPYADENYMFSPKTNHVGELNKFWGTMVNWTEHLEYLFGPAAITKSTSVTISHPEYFFRMDYILDVELGPLDVQARRLNNYLVWRVAEAYLRALSWDYEYALTTFLKETRINYSADDFSYQEICFQHVEQHMPDALNFLFLREHFYAVSKDELKNLTDHLMLATHSVVDETPWMDNETRELAKENLGKIVFKIGSPDWATDQNLVDQLYSGLTINESDFFGNMLRLQRHHWIESTKILSGADTTHELWGHSRVYYLPEMWKDDNEIVVYAGLLQPPVYSIDQPYSLTFGSLGTQIALHLLQTADDSSRWTNETRANYDTKRQCLAKVFSNIFGEQLPPALSNETQTGSKASLYSDLSIMFTRAVEVTFKAYQGWLNSQRAVVDALPGLNLSDEQLVMLGCAQRHCFSRQPAHSFSRQTEPQLEEDKGIDFALGQLPQFAELFQCKTGSPMKYAEECTL